MGSGHGLLRGVCVLSTLLSIIAASMPAATTHKSTNFLKI